MCVYSAIGDYARDNWTKRYPFIQPWVDPGPHSIPPPSVPAPTREEFEGLAREVRALKDLLQAAKTYDKMTHQPDCEMEEKIELIRNVAKFVGVDLSEVLS